MKKQISSIFPKVLEYKNSILNGFVIGFFVGFSIVLYNLIIDHINSMIKNFSGNLIFIFPFIGMLVTGLIIKRFNIINTSMADEIVYAVHSDPKNVKIEKTAPKLLGSIATIGFGASAGMEGASKWLGGIIGLIIHRIKIKFTNSNDSKELQIKSLLIGAASGIAAIFRAPLSGTIMALESPYKKDFAHEPLVEAFIASTTSYTIFSFCVTKNKFFLINLNYNLKVIDIFIAALIGLIAGLSSLIFLKSLHFIKNNITSKQSILIKYVIGGLLLSSLSFLCIYFFGKPISMFSGLDVINEITTSKQSNLELVFFTIIKSIATIITFAFGGLGGLFLPSATIGALLGQLIQQCLHFATPEILPFIGIAAFIAANYNGLLFGPVLIAEISGEPSLVVLGIIASTIAFMVSNGVSNSIHQKIDRSEID